MIDPVIRATFATTIGIECHVQLKTKTKLFSAVGNDAREAPANTLVSHIDFGLPGALPVLNKEAVYLAVKAAFALGTTPERFSKFDRKHYFYPDLPKGYQITQFDQPIIGKGAITIDIDGVIRTIGITRAHMEEDAGKSTHPAGKDYSLVDLNRAGTPLLEIVSEPDMHSSAEAKAYAHELYLRMRYADVSDANLFYGNMRFDVNVSVSKTDELGTRTETKNINSFRAVEKVVEYEVNRQIEVLQKGEVIVQETRGWDDAKQCTFSQRIKENADDYRYMPDPDLPPIVLDDAYIAAIKAVMPVMPDEWRVRMSDLGLDKTQTETLLDNPELLMVVGDAIDQKIDQKHIKTIANWLTSHVMKHVATGYDLATRYKMDVNDWLVVAEMVERGDLSSSRAKDLIDALLFDVGLIDPNASLEQKRRELKQSAIDKDLIQESDEGAIAAVVAQVLAENPKAAADVRSGETKAIGFLVGQVMKLSQGKANPGLAQQLIKKQLAI